MLVLKPATSQWKILDRAPTVAEFLVLVDAVGWTRYTNRQSVKQALDNSLFCVVAILRKEVIGTGRLGGDGARFIYVQDLMVAPAHQRQGVGTALLDRLMHYINQRAAPKTYVHLFTDRTTAPFYARYGFRGPKESFYGMSVKKFGRQLNRNRAGK